MTRKESNSWQAELPVKYNNEDLKDAVFVSIKVKERINDWTSMTQTGCTTHKQPTAWISVPRGGLCITPTSAVPRTFNIHITGTFGSFAGWRRGWPTASPPHPVPNAPIILLPACGYTNIKQHFANKLVSSPCGVHGDPSAWVRQRWVQFVLWENHAV